MVFLLPPLVSLAADNFLKVPLAMCSESERDDVDMFTVRQFKREVGWNFLVLMEMNLK
jgi:hypothetical protein